MKLSTFCSSSSSWICYNLHLSNTKSKFMLHLSLLLFCFCSHLWLLQTFWFSHGNPFVGYPPPSTGCQEPSQLQGKTPSMLALPWRVWTPNAIPHLLSASPPLWNLITRHSSIHRGLFTRQWSSISSLPSSMAPSLLPAPYSHLWSCPFVEFIFSCASPTIPP